MQPSPQEAERLAVLYGYGVLDTGFEERYDRLTRIASRILGTPISLISLIDENRQWFKSAFGLDMRETPRDVSLCSHAIEQDKVFVVPDATCDERFANYPLVTGEPHIRFYAGAPLIGREGKAIGTLCVIDNKPRAQFSAEEQQVLRDLADTVVEMFELRMALSGSQALTRKLRPLVEELDMLVK